MCSDVENALRPDLEPLQISEQVNADRKSAGLSDVPPTFLEVTLERSFEAHPLRYPTLTRKNSETSVFALRD